MSILIKGGNVVLKDMLIRADVYIEGSKIKSIGWDLNVSADELIDARGLTVMAGFVDMHCHLRDPGFEYKEDIFSGTNAALHGGFTSIACMPNTNPVIDNCATVRYVLSRAAESDKSKVYPIGAITKGQNGIELSEMGRMKEAGIVAVSDDGRPVKSAMMMRNGLEYAKSHDLLLISHCEDATLSEGGFVNEGLNSTASGLKGIPKSAEEVMIARDIILAAATGAKLHLAHVSTKGGVELVRRAKKDGFKVTAETCPHYFSATDDEILSYNTSAKINPPLREEVDINAIIDGLKDGTIDAIATDHAPHSRDEKNMEFAYAPFGSVGFETAFAVSYTFLVDAGHITLPQLSRLMSANPASILKIGSGILAENETADIVIVDTESTYDINKNTFKSKSSNSVFDGWRVKGKVVHAICDGILKV